MPAQVFRARHNILMEPVFAHVSAYRFVEVSDGEFTRNQIHARAQSLGLLGTFLIASEGINFCMAGENSAVRSFVQELEADLRFAALDSKWSTAPTMPYKKLIVRVKSEIIRMNSPRIRPIAQRASAVDANTLRAWLDRGEDDGGRPVVMLDTRNVYELEHGKFESAIEFGISQFSEFPKAAEARREELSGKTVVTYCTGGIRCEKAALVLSELGFENVHQLDGGILRYFEEQGSAHYQGGCFVFDKRVTLEPKAMRGS